MAVLSASSSRLISKAMSISWSSWPPMSLRYPSYVLARSHQVSGHPLFDAGNPGFHGLAQMQQSGQMRASPASVFTRSPDGRTPRAPDAPWWKYGVVRSAELDWTVGTKLGWWREASATVGSTPQLHHLRSGAARYALSHVTRSITRQPVTVLSPWPILGPVGPAESRS